MLLAEFIRRTGFTPEFADTLSSNCRKPRPWKHCRNVLRMAFSNVTRKSWRSRRRFGPGTAGIERAVRGGTGAARLRESDHRRGIPAR